MKVTFLPQTKLGKSSAELGVILLVMLGIMQLVANMPGAVGDQNVLNNPLVGMPKIGTVLVAFITLATGLIAIIKSKERSLLVYIVTLTGFLVIAMRDQSFLN